MAAAVRSLSPSTDYTPRIPIPNLKVKDKVTLLFRSYCPSVCTSCPSEEQLSDHTWCVTTLLNIANRQSSDRKHHKEAVATCHIVTYLLRKSPRPTHLPSWSDVKADFNGAAPTAAKKESYRCAATLQLEEALQLGGIVESDRDRDVVLAREQLATLAGLHDNTISFCALDALCSLLAHNLGSEEEIEHLFVALNEITNIMKRDKDTMSRHKVQKCIEVCALILDRWTLLYNQGSVLARDFHGKYDLWNLIEYFRLLNTKGNPDIAAWGTFALERLKHVNAPISLVLILSETERLLKDAAITAASIHEAHAAKSASKAKDVGLGVAKTVAKARYLAPGQAWAASLEQILSQVEAAKSNASALEGIQKQMARTLKKDPSHSFAYFCVQILTEIIQGSEDEAVQKQAFYHEKLPTLLYFYTHITENMMGQIIDPSSKVGKMLGKIRAKLPKGKCREDVWKSPRLILSVALALQEVKGHSNLSIRGEAAICMGRLENCMKHDEHQPVQMVYQNRIQNEDLQKEHYALLTQTLGTWNSHAQAVKEHKRIASEREAISREKEELEMEALRLKVAKTRVQDQEWAIRSIKRQLDVSSEEEKAVTLRRLYDVIQSFPAKKAGDASAELEEQEEQIRTRLLEERRDLTEQQSALEMSAADLRHDQEELLSLKEALRLMTMDQAEEDEEKQAAFLEQTHKVQDLELKVQRTQEALQLQERLNAGQKDLLETYEKQLAMLKEKETSTALPQSLEEALQKIEANAQSIAGLKALEERLSQEQLQIEAYEKEIDQVQRELKRRKRALKARQKRLSEEEQSFMLIYGHLETRASELKSIKTVADAAAEHAVVATSTLEASYGKRVIDGSTLIREDCFDMFGYLMTDAVMTVPSGYTYSRRGIEKWIRERGTDPMTRKTITIEGNLCDNRDRQLQVRAAQRIKGLSEKLEYASRDSLAHTDLYRAVKAGDIEQVVSALRRGASPTVLLESESTTSLDIAVGQEDSSLLEILKYNLKDDVINIRDELGRTALFEVRTLAAVQILLDKGVNHTILDKSGKAALEELILHHAENESIAKLTELAYGNVPILSQALGAALESEDEPLVGALVVRGAKYDYADALGNTLLMHAVRQNWHNAVKALLMRRNVDKSKRNNDGKLAVDMATDLRIRLLLDPATAPLEFLPLPKGRQLFPRPIGNSPSPWKSDESEGGEGPPSPRESDGYDGWSDRSNESYTEGDEFGYAYPDEPYRDGYDSDPW